MFQSIHLLIVSWRSTMFGWDIAKPIFDLENSRSRSWPRSNSWKHVRPKIQSLRLLCRFVTIRPIWLTYSKLHIRPWKLEVKVMTKSLGHDHDKSHWSHMRPIVQSMSLFFFSWQSDHLGWSYSKVNISPWKFKVKVRAKITPNDRNWRYLEFNRYVCS